MKIYGDLISGNCYKLKLLCDLLSIEHEWVQLDILREETRTSTIWPPVQRCFHRTALP